MTEKLSHIQESSKTLLLHFLEEFKSEIKLMNKPELELIKKKIDFLCMNYDPYSTIIENQVVLNIIEEFKIEPFLDDPFETTHLLLKISDLLEQRIKSHKRKVH